MLDGKVLGKEIWAKIKSSDHQNTEIIWEIVASLICKHIQKNAVVKPGITVITDKGTGKTTTPGKII